MKIMEKLFFEKIQNGRQINNGVTHYHFTLCNLPQSNLHRFSTSKSTQAYGIAHYLK
jgi:hypothetical protein